MLPSITKELGGQTDACLLSDSRYTLIQQCCYALVTKVTGLPLSLKGLKIGDVITAAR